METKSTGETALPAATIELADTPVSSAVAEPAPPTNSATQRPVGVSVIAGVNFVGALLIGILLLISIVEKLDLGITAVVWPISVVCALAVGIGLVQLKNWARILAFVVYGVNIVWDIYSIVTGPVPSGTFVQLGIAAIIIWYLRQPKVAEAFD